MNLDEIHKNFFFNKKPFVIRSIYSSTSPNIWGDKMLSKRFGNYEFRIQMKQLRNGWEEKSIKLTEFLKKYHYEEWKLRSPIYEEMKNELTVWFGTVLLNQYIPDPICISMCDCWKWSTICFIMAQ